MADLMYKGSNNVASEGGPDSFSEDCGHLNMAYAIENYPSIELLPRILSTVDPHLEPSSFQPSFESSGWGEADCFSMVDESFDVRRQPLTCIENVQPAPRQDFLPDSLRGHIFRSASHRKCPGPWDHSDIISTIEESNKHRFKPYYKLENTRDSFGISSHHYSRKGKPTRVRKRTVVLKPKFPKYEGLSHFAAPSDLLGESIPFKSTNQSECPSSPPLVPASCAAQSDLKDPSNFGVNQARSPNALSPVPIDFLKHISLNAWSERKTELEQMVEDRKNLFLSNGFAETSGTAFQPDENSIEKKPVPNRWVWYMHLSTEYDKIRNTKVPSGGPAGYLKHGWDRLGADGKKPYQELADVYSASRLKFMADHGIAEESHKKLKTKKPEKFRTPDRPPKPFRLNNENDDKNMSETCPTSESSQAASSDENPTEVPASNCFFGEHIDALYSSAHQAIHTGFLQHDGAQSSLGNPPVSGLPGESGMTPVTTELPFFSSYLQSPEFLSDFLCSISQQGLLESEFTSEPAQQLGSPITLFSSLGNQPLDSSCSPAFTTGLSSEFQAWPSFTPSSFRSPYSDISGALPTPYFGHAQASTTSLYTSSSPISPLEFQPSRDWLMPQ